MIDDIYKQEYLDHKKLSERRKVAMSDVSGRGKEATFEVNWNKFVRKEGYIKINIGNEEIVISRDQLWTIMFMLGSAKEQEQLVSPWVKKTQVTKFYKMLGITAMKDIKKGEALNVPLEFTLNPSTNQVIIGKGSVNGMRKELEGII